MNSVASKKVEVRGLEMLSSDFCASEIQAWLGIVPGMQGSPDGYGNCIDVDGD